MSTGKKIIHVVHCIDTEGPLHEPLEATFERLRYVFGVTLEPTRENLRRLQDGEVDLGGNEAAVRQMVAPELLRYNDTWDAVDRMLEDALNPPFRDSFTDSFGGHWIYNWFCVDHVGYEGNPRRRDMGYGNVFDHYFRYVRAQGMRDGFQFHYHPMPFSRQAHHCATHYFAHADTLFRSLAWRIIERGWFPSCYRPGFHTIRPDSHWFLEQFLPFDFSNQATDEASGQKDMAGGRFGDWRRAPATWVPYRPDHDDYQRPGNCRRHTMRCLNVGTRTRCLRQSDVDQAFAEAGQGLPVILAFADHDFRDIRPDVRAVAAMLEDAARRHPGVGYRFCEAREAARSALGLDAAKPLALKAAWQGDTLLLEADRPIFGPQPFLALKTRTGQYLHDNFDIQTPFRAWSYVLDAQTVPAGTVEAIGAGACDAAGNVTVVRAAPGGPAESFHW